MQRTRPFIFGLRSVGSASFLSFFGFVLVFNLVLTQCNGQERVWNSGVSSGNWHTSSNWIPQDVPDTLQEIAVFDGTKKISVSCNQTTSISDVDWSNPNLDFLIRPLATGQPLTFAVFDGFEINGSLVISNEQASTSQLVVIGDIISRSQLTLSGEAGGTVAVRAANFDNIETLGIPSPPSGFPVVRILEIETFSNFGTVDVAAETVFLVGDFFKNDGLFRIGHETHLQGDSFFQFHHDTGSLDVYDEGDLLIEDCHFVLDGGQILNLGKILFNNSTIDTNAFDISGNSIQLQGCTVNLSETGVGSFALEFERGTSNCLAGSNILHESQAISICSGSPSQTDAVTSVTIDGDFENNGRISLVADVANSKSKLTVGETLTNNGILETTASTINPSSVTLVFNGDLINNGLIDLMRKEFFFEGNSSIINFDTITVHPAATFGTQHNQTQLVENCGSLIVDGTMIVRLDGEFVNQSDSILKGSGQLVFSESGGGFVNYGIISPGNSVGTLEVDGSVVFAETARLEIEIGGTTPDLDYDVLAVDGSSKLQGNLEVSFANSFEESILPTDVFRFFTSQNGLTGTFDGIADKTRIMTNDGHGSFLVNYDSIGINLSHYEPNKTLLGDVNLDGDVNLLDVVPFVQILTDGLYQAEADIDQNGVVNLLDVAPFVGLLSP